jgi:chromosome segregation ATPase
MCVCQFNSEQSLTITTARNASLSSPIASTRTSRTCIQSCRNGENVCRDCFLSHFTLITRTRLSVVKTHKSTVVNREREVLAREAALREKEQQLASTVSSKDNEIASLRHMVAHLEQQQHRLQQDAEMAIKAAVARREEELRILVTKREAEVAEAMARREQEIMEAVRKREAEVLEEWRTRETNMRREIEEKIKGVQDRVDWIQAREEELAGEDIRLETVRAELEDKVAKWGESAAKGQTGPEI